MRTVPGTGAQFTPIFNSDYGVESFIVGAGGTDYDPNDPPKIEIDETNVPIQEGVFFPVIRNGEIVRIAVLEKGFGYSPLILAGGTKVGIATTSFVESSLLVRTGVGTEVSVSVASTDSHVIMAVEGSEGSSILENGYNKTITQSGYAGTSAPVVPDGSSNQNAFYGFTHPFESYATSGVGTGSKYNVFIVYDSGTGNAISTSIVLREGGNGYAVGDTVSIAGTYMGGQTPTNDLTFTVSAVANTRIPAQANVVYSGLEAETIVGSGTSAIFEISRDGLGDITDISVTNGGRGYEMTSLLKILGTAVGGVTPQDDIFLSPKVLGADKLPQKLYVRKLDNNTFTVSGLSTSSRLDITSVGEGTHTLEYEDSNESSIISIDNIVQNPLYKRDLSVGLAQTVGYTSSTIYLTGISSITVADTIQVGSEFFKINTIGLGATNEFGVTRGYLGTRVDYHAVGTAVTIHRGDYNIVNDEIHFTTAPYGPVGPEGLKVNSTFSGRAFSRRFDPGTPNDKNVIFDDLSTQFVGASSTEFVLRTNEERIVGIYTDTNTVLASGIDVNNNPLVFINNVPQISGTDFVVDNDSNGNNRIRFLTGTPSAGRIVRTGLTSGTGYVPLVGAGATVTVSHGHITDIHLRGGGSGYRNPPEIFIESSTGAGAAFTCTVGAGGTISSISILNGGTGYPEHRSAGISTANYEPTTGVLSITSANHGIEDGDNVKIPTNSIVFTCTSDGNTSQVTYPRLTDPAADRWLAATRVDDNTIEVNVGSSNFVYFTPTGANYDPATGVMELTIGNHSLAAGTKIKLANNSLTFTCAQDSHNTQHTYPRSTDPYYDTSIVIDSVTATTITINVGAAAPADQYAHTFVSALTNAVISGGNYPHTFVSASADLIIETEVVNVNIGIPSNYFSVPLVYADGYTGNGEGAKADIQVGNSGDIISFMMSDPGEFYRVQDVLTPDTSSNGLVTTTSGTFTEFLVEVEEIMTDKFSGFYPGQFIQFDNIEKFFNGSKKKFTLTVSQGGETEILSLKIDPTSDMDLAQNIFVYINDILQAPNQSYDFDGSRIVFTEAPVPNSKCTILYYRGSDLDVEQVDPPRTIKEGDGVQIGDNVLDPKDRPQFERIVKKIISSNSLDTFTYDSIGINTDPTAERPLNWIKQTEDKIINGVLYSKARPDLKSRVEPTAKLIKTLTPGASEIYVDNAYPIFVDVDQLSEDINNVKVVDTGEIRPGLASAFVSAASTVSSVQVRDHGIGFYRNSNPVVAISSATISMKDPIFGWVGISTTSGISTTNTYNDIVIGKPIVAVGSSGALGISTNGFEWAEEYIGYGGTINFNSVAVAATSRFFIAGDNQKLVVNTGVGTGFSNPWTEIRLLKEDIVLGLPQPVISFSQYSGNFQSVSHSSFHDTSVVVGSNNGVFSGVGIGTTAFFERTPGTFANFNAVANNGGVYVAVGDNATIIHSSDGGFIWAQIPPLPSTRNFLDVIWTGTQFVLVGENGTIFTSTAGTTNWNRIIPNITDHLHKIKYEYGVYVAVNHVGQVLFSLDLSYWTFRDTNQTQAVSDLAFIPVPPPAFSRPAGMEVVNEDGRYILVGAGGTIMYADPVYNRATATANLVNGVLDSVNVDNPGFGYLSNPPIIIESGTALQEEVFSIKAEGDFGEIVEVGVGNSFIDFKLKSEEYDNATLGIGYSSLNIFGITNSQISEGDYFVITDSNSEIGAGLALTGITTSTGGLNNYAESVVGVAYTTLDGVYRAERVSAPHAGIVTVRCMFAFQNNAAIQVNVNNNTNGIHGKYSWGRIYDFQNRAVFSPKHFTVDLSDGLTGLSTSADVFRTRGLK